jgi:hypothetical protein
VRKGREPLLDPRLARTSGYAAGLGIGLVYFIGFTGIWLIVEVGVDAGELYGQAFGVVGQERVPGAKRRGGDAKQRDLQYWQRCHSTTTSQDPIGISAPMRSGLVKGAWKI